MSEAQANRGPLAGLTVLDLSRVLAGPWATQMLGDLGADVIKVEQPGMGDDTRRWGPPFLPDGSNDSAYYLCTNRNKRSIAVNMADPEGAEVIRRLAEGADIVVENFRVGGLAKYGLDYESLRAIKPDLIYCSVTGFGQTGPLKDNGGYDFLIQGMSGLMSVTGAADGGPTKVGIPISDLVTGMYATISILAALNHRNATGEGQHIDVALLDSQVALLANQASNFLNGGMVPKRMGNQHPSIVPYQDFACSDGDVLVALGNDKQFRSFCTMLGRSDLAADEAYASTALRSRNRTPLLSELAGELAKWKSGDLIAEMRKLGLPGGRINEIPEVLSHPQIEERGMVHEIARSDGTAVKFLGFPGKFSAAPATYRFAPPRSGEDTADVLRAELGLSEQEIARLREAGVIAEEL
ncbi:CaiB/BaiF CoA transferase family protein [Tsuneonella mangrovi]|uniref:CaiB/BaiF CoA transferase family protein n=1 Tax=Tsuneonella mangrovi TaxID=1982042 RepID=UPI000BA2517D|nr:CaiB/BaiF CoA-transferase family protein [Tsuneonella mangrovi]